MKRITLARPWSALLVLLLLLPTLPARADTWRVDLIVFRFLSSVDERGRLPQAPGEREAIELDDSARLSAAGITVLPDSDFGMGAQWDRLRASPQFRPLIKLAWTQNDPPAENGPRLRLRSGQKLQLKDQQGLGEREFNEVDGSVALHLGRYLHLDTDLLYTVGGEPAQTWRLQESRRMRSEELHHLDSPRLGVLVRVSKWGPGLTSQTPAPPP